MERVFKEAIREARSNGQTVFLSSHILGEVEELCDRIGVLRSGKLVELGTLQEMRHLSSVTIVATFESKPPSLDNITGVSNVVVHAKRLSCQVSGPISDVLQVLAAAKPLTLLSREPSLEELFLSLYGET